MHLSANLSLVYRDRPLLDAVNAAARAGFRHVELWWPTERDLAGSSLGGLAAAISEQGLAVDLLNVPAGDMGAGDRGLASNPALVASFRAGVERALEYATRLGCAKVNALGGNVLPDQPLAVARGVALENIAWAAERAGGAGVDVVLEGLNPAENPAYVWPTIGDAAAAVSAMGLPNVAVLADVYHIAMAGLHPVAEIERSAARIGHVQLADSPGRHEPGTATLDFGAIVDALAGRYDGSVGLEFLPLADGAPDFQRARAAIGPLGA